MGGTFVFYHSLAKTANHLQRKQHGQLVSFFASMGITRKRVIQNVNSLEESEKAALEELAQKVR